MVKFLSIMLPSPPFYSFSHSVDRYSYFHPEVFFLYGKVAVPMTSPFFDTGQVLLKMSSDLFNLRNALGFCSVVPQL